MVVITFNGERHVADLRTALAGAGLPVRSFAVDNRDEFRLNTGVQSTPMLIVLDEAARVRSSTVEFSDSARAATEEALDGEASAKSSSLGNVLPDGR